MATKENDGKALRHQKLQKMRILAFLLLLMATISLLVAIGYFSIKKVSQGNRSTPQFQWESLRRKRQWLLPMREALSDSNYRDSMSRKQSEQILLSSVHLVDIEFDRHRLDVNPRDYQGVVAVFCALEFAAQKETQTKLPMFHDLMSYSHCQELRNQIRVDLSEAVQLAREFDADLETPISTSRRPTLLELKGVVFHESRCGSTLAANSMLAVNPQKHRVYSEATPPIKALMVCGEDFSQCSREASANLLKDVIYIMRRTNQPQEKFLFYKFQSMTTRTMQAFRIAFPTTPWIFLYREPVQVMMSQLDLPLISNANCVRSKKSSVMVRSFIQREGYDMNDLADEEFCAVHLATLCESALKNLEDAKGVGIAVRYSPVLVNDFLDFIFPKHFQILVDQAGKDRVLKISETYSKNRGLGKEDIFIPDSQNKEKHASEAIKMASKLFLEPTYATLEHSPYNINHIYNHFEK